VSELGAVLALAAGLARAALVRSRTGLASSAPSRSPLGSSEIKVNTRVTPAAMASAANAGSQPPEASTVMPEASSTTVPLPRKRT
jgi:hypothetical protein